MRSSDVSRTLAFHRPPPSPRLCHDTLVGGNNGVADVVPNSHGSRCARAHPRRSLEAATRSAFLLLRVFVFVFVCVCVFVQHKGHKVGEVKQSSKKSVYKATCTLGKRADSEAEEGRKGGGEGVSAVRRCSTAVLRACIIHELTQTKEESEREAREAATRCHTWSCDGIPCPLVWTREVQTHSRERGQQKGSGSFTVRAREKEGEGWITLARRLKEAAVHGGGGSTHWAQREKKQKQRKREEETCAYAARERKRNDTRPGQTPPQQTRRLCTRRGAGRGGSAFQ